MRWERYLGIPFLPGGRDAAKGLDCWGLVVHVYSQEFGITVSPYAAPLGQLTKRDEAKAELEAGLWIETSNPLPGDGVAMGSRNRFSHVGIFIDIGSASVLHSSRSASCIQTVNYLLRNGYPLMKFFRHVERPLH